MGEAVISRRGAPSKAKSTVLASYARSASASADINKVYVGGVSRTGSAGFMFHFVIENRVLTKLTDRTVSMNADFDKMISFNPSTGRISISSGHSSEYGVFLVEIE